MKKLLSLLAAGFITGSAFAQPTISTTEGLGRYKFLEQDARVYARIFRNDYSVKNLQLRLWIDNNRGLSDEALLPTMMIGGSIGDMACDNTAQTSRLTEEFGAGYGLPGTDSYIYDPLWVAGADVYASVRAKYCDDSWSHTGTPGFDEKHYGVVDVRSLYQNSLGVVKNLPGGCSAQVVGSFSIADSLKSYALNGIDVKLDNLHSTATEADLGNTIYLYYEEYSPTATFDGTEPYVTLSGNAANYNTDPGTIVDGRYTGVGLNIPMTGTRMQFYVVVCNTPASTGKSVILTIPSNSIWLSGDGVSVGQLRMNELAISATPVVLPVEFKDVKATYTLDKKGRITWTVGTEDKLARYELQKSTNGTNWTTIASVVPTNSSEYTEYDNSPAEMNYYKVKSVDFDGKIAYSKTVSLSTKGSVKAAIIGNPVVNNNLRIVDLKAGAKVNILEATGRVLMSYTATQAIEDKNIATLPSGSYIVTINDRGSIQSLKFNKQ